MGREQRSRKYLPEGAVCYLCGRPILQGEDWDRDHVPPRRFFGKSVRARYNPNLDWLYAHVACNSAYKDDEEYFVLSFVGHHLESPSARSVWEDVQRGASEGHSTGLIKTILDQFGKVVLPDGSVTFAYDAARSRRVIWKLARGIYMLESGRLLLQAKPHHIEIVPRSEAPRRIPAHPWFGLLRPTESLGRHPGVFDWKWIGVKDGPVRLHAMAILVWDGLIALIVFHDPGCPCEQCAPQSGKA